MKKLFALVLVIVLLGTVCFTGCSNATVNEAGTSDSDAQQGDENVVNAETQATGSENITTISIWHSMEGNNGEAFAQLIDDFNATRGKELGIVAENVFQGTDTAVKLKTLIQTNDVENMPDVCQIFSVSLPIIAECEQTVFVDDMYGQGSGLVSRDDIFKSMRDTYSYEGKQVSMPFNASAILLYCNMDAFKSVGLTEGDIPATWDEVIELTKKLTIRDGDKVSRYGFNMQLGLYELSEMVGTQNSLITDMDNGRSGLSTKIVCKDQVRNAFGILDELNQTGGLNPLYNNQNEEFATGINAMTVMSSARIASVTNLAGEMNWCAAPFPRVSKTDNGGVGIGGASLAMFSKGDEAKKNAAWEFIMYAASAEAQSKWSMQTGYLPVNVATQDREEYKSYVEKNPAVQVAIDEIQADFETVPSLVLNMQAEINSIVRTAASSLVEGSTDVDSAVEAFVSESEAAFEQYNRANS